MSHQDWNVVTLNSSAGKKSEIIKTEKQKKISNYIPEKGTIKLEAPKKLGTIISQARTTKNKTQKQLSAELGISALILSRWESNKDAPDNAQIAKMEKILGIKMPRCKKVKLDDD
jgi:ribosome-binding protein aMBF1 (putative translation factor)